MAHPAEPALRVVVGGHCYDRVLVHTHLIHIKEDLQPLLEEHVRPLLGEGDWVAMSEKVVAISEGRVVHHSVVRPGPLAKLIVKGTRKYENDVAFSDPRKMQVAIMQTGSTRAAFAMVVGGITKLFGRHGDFWRIAGHRIAEIDGFNPDTVQALRRVRHARPGRPGQGVRRLCSLHRPSGRDHRRQQHQRRGAGHEPGHARRQGHRPSRASRQPDGPGRRAHALRDRAPRQHRAT